MKKDRPIHPWRTWHEPSEKTPPHRQKPADTDANDFHGVYGQKIDLRAFGSRLRRGFADLASAYEEQ